MVPSRPIGTSALAPRPRRLAIQLRGYAVALQMVHGQDPDGGGAVTVVNDQMELPVMALPAQSFTPLLPPVITAV